MPMPAHALPRPCLCSLSLILPSITTSNPSHNSQPVTLTLPLTLTLPPSQVGPALAVGCTVVVKPSEARP